MDNTLMRYAQGTQSVPRQDRAVARRAQAVFDDVRIADLQAKGMIALTGSMMEGIVQLDARAQFLAEGDPIRYAMLCEFTGGAIRQLSQIQSKLGNSWGF